MSLDIPLLREAFLNKRKATITTVSNGENMKTNFFDNCGIRNFEEDGKTYLCAIDFSNALGYKNNTGLYVHCPKESRKLAQVKEKSGLKNRAFFESESVLSHLGHSRSERAKAFADWIRDLTSGAPAQPKGFAEQAPQNYVDALRELAKQVEEKEALQAQLEQERAKSQAQPSYESIMQILGEMLKEAEKRKQEEFSLK